MDTRTSCLRIDRSARSPERLRDGPSGGDFPPVRAVSFYSTRAVALRHRADRFGVVHVNDVRLESSGPGVKAERADALTAGQHGRFCAPCQEGVDLDACFADLDVHGYEGWVVFEQDRVSESGGAF